MKKLAVSLLAIFASFMFTAQAETIQHGQLEISKAMMRAVMPGGKVTAAYMTITNNGSKDDALVAVRYDGAKKSEIHNMEVVNDVMKMRPLDGPLAVPAGETVMLKKGGLHLMFMGLTEKPKAGDMAEITLEFAETGPITIIIPVKKMMHSH